MLFTCPYIFELLYIYYIYIWNSSHRHRRTEQEEDEELLSECKKSNASASFRFEESPSCKHSLSLINFWLKKTIKIIFYLVLSKVG